ncbi:hypothetical protein F5Y00DRAFT_273600 [Daldinia vernicosa]|uniref:uncharacterized protein n=1 Tax=Daldinia vernicosa TaxID=114800 RepID=UPI00200820EC|nr:uncharacterized protein F5Y00DRAFT_273600 [Daldinia vernicosa]KAI0844668.1 hypothetical protein F5Y00DRAFT_273600 [Daldinia vernicosa]
MPETFHSFGRLPPELRDKIWKLAIRPGGTARRGAHIFSIHRGSGRNIENAVVVAASGFKLHLAAPKYEPRSIDTGLIVTSGQEVTSSWTHHNFSTYLIDGGLWNACKESRLVIERVFDSEKWDAARGAYPPSPATSYFRGDDSTNRYFTVIPSEDLFYLQPQTFGYFMLECIGKWNGVALGSRRWGFTGLANIALEYDPAWGILVEKTDPDTRDRLIIIDLIIKTLFHAKGLSCIWFVDYRIKQRCYVPTKKEASCKGPIIFYGSDRRFVEVRGGVDKWETDFEDDAGINSSCCKFIDAVEYVLEDRMLPFDMSGSGGIWPPHFGVLACEYV